MPRRPEPPSTAPASEPIAIIGMGCRFPGAPNLGAFWRLLCDGTNAIVEVPKDRWDLDAVFHPDPSAPGMITSRFGGFLEHVDEFDPAFFGITPREAPHVDPRQRLTLESVWEALEDAGLPPDRLAGTRTSVFIATLTSDYDTMLFGDLRRADAFSGAGTATSTIANRVSYFLDLHGPSLTVDTACSGALVSVHLACESLRTGESTLALAGGVNLNLLPRSSVFFSKAGALSPRGQCRAFDRDADGMIRSDGVGVVVLKRLADAVADGDPIAAVVRATAVNHGGRGHGLMAPTPEGQAALLAEAYRRAGVSPHDVQYIEAHGTGTRLGDPIEAEALGTLMAGRRLADRPCLLGSVKTNIGHTEAAAGIAGVIKTALALRHRLVPANLHFETPNPLIPFDRLPFIVPTRLGPWPDPARPLIAGVSAFGFGGANGHVVLSEPPPPREGAADAPPFVMPMSARTPAALIGAVRALCTYLDGAQVALPDVCYTAASRRMHHACRVAPVVSSLADLRRQLDDWLAAPEGRRSLVRRESDECRAANATAVAYEAGEPIDWSRQHPRGGRVVPLPPYAWQRERYWFDQLSGARDEVLTRKRAGLRHPLLGERIDAAAPIERGGVSGTLSLWEMDYESDRPRFLGDHRVHGEVVLPGAAIAEMAVAAGRDVFAGGTLELRDLTFVRAFVVPPGERQRAQVTMSTAGDEAEFTLFGRAARSGAGEPWTLHARGRVRVVRATSECAPIDLAAIRARCGPPVSIEAHYASMSAAGVDDGPAFRAIVQLQADGSEALGEIRLPQVVSDLGYLVHPVILDAAMHVAAAAMGGQRDPETSTSSARVYLPAGVSCWQVMRPGPAGPIWCHARVRGTAGDDQVVADLDLVGRDGTLSGRMTGLRLARVGVARERRVADSLLERRWVPAPVRAPGRSRQDSGSQNPESTPGFDSRSPAAMAGTWLLLADAAGVADVLASGLRAAGHRVITARAGADYAQLDADTFRIRPGAPDDFRAAIAGVGAAIHGVVHLWSLDIDEGDDGFEAASRLGIGAALHLTQAMVRAARPASLWFVTRGDVRHSPLNGFALAMEHEHPELGCTVVDLDPVSSIEEAARALMVDVSSPDGERQISWRDGSRSVARLTRLSTPIAPDALGPVALRPDATYLVTGGLGALGLQTARMLVTRGARHLVLTSRQAHPDAALAIADLERQGAVVVFTQMDVAERAAVDQLFDATLSRLPALRGVIHAAGVLDDALLAEQTLGTFDAVMRPKVQGTWHLHARTLGLPLDFFICYSSMASLIGSPGQTNYASANAFMDALMRMRRARGVPALSINWGAWGDAGMAAGDRLRHRLAARGVSMIDPDDALGWLSGLLRPDLGVPEVGVFPVDWPAFLRQFPNGAPPLFAEFGHLGNAPRPTVPARAVSERSALLRGYLRDALTSVLGFDALTEIGPHETFTELGMDSLMAVEFSNRLEARLGMSLDATLAFDHPTLDALYSHLSALIAHAPGSSARAI